MQLRIIGYTSTCMYIKTLEKCINFTLTAG